MNTRRNNAVFERINSQLDFEQAIVNQYVSGKFLTKQIAQNYGISPRSVQRIVRKWGSVRTQAEGNRIAGPLGPKHRVRTDRRVRAIVQRRNGRGGKAKEYQLNSLRAIVIALMQDQGRDFGTCELCGSKIQPGKFDLHHTKYEGSTFQDLLIVCRQCNLLPQNQYLD